MADPDTNLRASRDADDLPPAHTEARAQDSAPLMPWLFGGLAIILIALVVVLMIVIKPLSQQPSRPQMPSTQAAPPTSPPSR